MQLLYAVQNAPLNFLTLYKLKGQVFSFVTSLLLSVKRNQNVQMKNIVYYVI